MPLDIQKIRVKVMPMEPYQRFIWLGTVTRNDYLKAVLDDALFFEEILSAVPEEKRFSALTQCSKIPFLWFDPYRLYSYSFADEITWHHSHPENIIAVLFKHFLPNDLKQFFRVAPFSFLEKIAQNIEKEGRDPIVDPFMRQILEYSLPSYRSVLYPFMHKKYEHISGSILDVDRDLYHYLLEAYSDPKEHRHARRAFEPNFGHELHHLALGDDLSAFEAQLGMYPSPDHPISLNEALLERTYCKETRKEVTVFNIRPTKEVLTCILKALSSEQDRLVFLNANFSDAMIAHLSVIDEALERHTFEAFLRNILQKIYEPSAALTTTLQCYPYGQRLAAIERANGSFRGSKEMLQAVRPLLTQEEHDAICIDFDINYSFKLQCLGTILFYIGLALMALAFSILMLVCIMTSPILPLLLFFSVSALGGVVLGLGIMLEDNVPTRLYHRFFSKPLSSTAASARPDSVLEDLPPQTEIALNL